MADRYLRGTGARNWNDTSNWSNTSGGTGGFSVPTSADNVIIDNNSGTGTVTVNATANMLNLTFGTISAITLNNAAYDFNVFGSLVLPASNLTVSFTGTGYLYFKSTSTGKTITSNGNTSGWNRIYFDGVGGTWTNQDDWNAGTSSIALTNGTWNQSIYNISSMAFGYGVGTATLTMVSGTFLTTQGCYFHTNSGGKTFNCGTGKIKNASTTGGSNLYVGANTFYDVEAYCISSGGGSGLCTFRNLTVTHNGVNGFIALNEGSPSWVINGTFTVSGYNAAERRIPVLGLIGTQRTITVNGSIVASNVNFREIKGAGTANWDLSGIDGGSGDCINNSGITFTPAQTLYFKHTSGAVNLSDATKWVTTDGGSTLGRVPLPQDYAYFTANSFAGTSTITFNMIRFCGFDMSGVNKAVTLYQNMAIEFYGDYILGENITTSLVYPSEIQLFGKSGIESKFNTYAKSLGASYLYIYRNTYKNYSDINMGNFNTAQFQMGNAVFYLNGYNLSCYIFGSIDPTTNSGGYFYAGSGTITINGSGFTIYRTRFIAETSTIIMNDSGTADQGVGVGSIYGSSVTINKLILQGTITGNYLISQINGSTTINELIINAGKKVKFQGDMTFSIGKLTANGTAGNLITIGSTTTATATLYSTKIQSTNYCNVSYISATGATFYGKNFTDGGNNAGWTSVASTGTSFALSKMIDSYGGKMYNYSIFSKALSASEVANRAALLRSIYPEIESVPIGTQTWAVRNYDAVCTPQGNLIPEVQSPNNVIKLVGSDFVVGGGWSKIGDILYANSATSAFDAYRALTGGVLTKIYKLTFTISNYVGGSVSFRCGGASAPTVRSGNGTFVEYLPLLGNNTFSFLAVTTFTATISNISVQEVGWSDSQNLYDYIYANTAGTTEQKTYAAVKAAGFWCHYNNDPANGAIYSKLYNWFAVKLLQMDIDYYNAANPTTPWGWRVSSDAEFPTDADSLKHLGNDFWTVPNTGTNTTGFTSLPGGYRDDLGSFYGINTHAVYNTQTKPPLTSIGASVRLIKSQN